MNYMKKELFILGLAGCLFVFLSDGHTLYPQFPKSFKNSFNVCLKSIIPIIFSSLFL